MGIARSGFSRQFCDGASTGSVARGWAISVADFSALFDAISTGGITITIVRIITLAGAASVTGCAGSNVRENTSDVAFSRGSCLRICGTGESVITDGGAVSITGFTRFHDVIGAGWGTIIIIEAIAPWRAAAIS